MIPSRLAASARSSPLSRAFRASAAARASFPSFRYPVALAMDVSLWGLATAASTSTRITRLIESLNFLLPRGFANRQDLIGGDGLQSLDIPTGPGNFH